MSADTRNAAHTFAKSKLTLSEMGIIMLERSRKRNGRTHAEYEPEEEDELSYCCWPEDGESVHVLSVGSTEI
jgi:hypothetical protein